MHFTSKVLWMKFSATAAVTAAQQLCWRNPKISCLSLQFVVSAHKIDLQAVSPVTELLPQVLQTSASATLQWFQSSFARSGTAVSGCRTPGNREREVWHIVVYQFHSMCFSPKTIQMYASD